MEGTYTKSNDDAYFKVKKLLSVHEALLFSCYMELYYHLRVSSDVSIVSEEYSFKFLVTRIFAGYKQISQKTNINNNDSNKQQ